MKEKGRTGGGSGEKGLRPTSEGVLCGSLTAARLLSSAFSTLPPTPPARLAFLLPESHLSIFKPTHSSSQESANYVPYIFPLQQGKNGSKPLILKTRRAGPIITRQRRAWGTHFALNKGQEAPQFTSCQSTRGRSPLLPRGRLHPVFAPERGDDRRKRWPTFSTIQCRKSNLHTTPRQKKKKKNSKKKPQNLKTKDPPPLTVTYLQKERDPKKTIGFPKKVRGFHQKSWKCTPYLPAF